jgi:phage shock protein PspC (stress-responsive transcriptional regulator)
LVPGRALGAVLDEAYGEGRRRDDDGIGVIESRDSEMRGGWRNGAQTERGTGAAGGVWFISGLGVYRFGIDQVVIRLACMLAAVMSVRIGHVLVGLRANIDQALAGLRVNRPA